MDDATFTRLDELTEKYDDLLDQMQEARNHGGNRADLDDEVQRMLQARVDETLRLHQAGIPYEEIEARLDATDRHRHDH